MANQPGKTQNLIAISDEDLNSGAESLQPGAAQKIHISDIAAALQNVDQILFNTDPPTYDFTEGRLYFDNVNKTLAIELLGGDQPVTLQIGQENHVYVRNNTGSLVSNASALTPIGALGNKIIFALSQANDILTASVSGVSTQDIANNGEGYATTFGVINDIDTQTPGWLEGDLLYLSDSVAGGLQNTPPSSGFTVAVGIVLRVHPTQGQIIIKPWPRPAFGDIFGGNYTQFSHDETMRAMGDAVCWRDELQSLVSSAALVTSANDIVKNTSEGSVTFKTSARYPTDYLVTNHQLNHDWENGTIIDPHLHWWQVSANMPNWLIEYRWQKQLQDKTTSWTPLVVDQNKGTWVSNPFNQITDVLGGITPPVGYGQVSDIVQLRVYRDVTNASGLFAGADPESADVDVINFDTHIRIDQLGSSQEYTKY